MGLFNKILKGLGFEDEEEVVVVEKQPRQKKKEKKVTATFDLNNLEEEVQTKEEKSQSIEQKVEEPAVITTGLEIISISNQVEVQNVVLKIKNGQKVIINLEKLAKDDVTRSLDFLTGAIYALGLSMQKIDNNTYLIQ